MSESQLLYALLQGLFEWLPVSSTGVLVLLGLGYQEALSIHLATGASGLLYLALRKRLEPRLIMKWGVLPLVTGAPIALLLERLAASLDPSLLRVATVTLYIVTLVALAVRLAAGRARSAEPSGRDPVITGVLEGVAVLPGVSRSGLVAAYLAARGLPPRIVTDAVIASGAVAGLAAGAYEALNGAMLSPAAMLVALVSSLASAYLLEFIGERGATILAMAIIAGLVVNLVAASLIH